MVNQKITVNEENMSHNQKKNERNRLYMITWLVIADLRKRRNRGGFL
jgi:hypothetical protein